MKLVVPHKSLVLLNLGLNVLGNSRCSEGHWWRSVCHWCLLDVLNLKSCSVGHWWCRMSHLRCVLDALELKLNVLGSSVSHSWRSVCHWCRLDVLKLRLNVLGNSKCSVGTGASGRTQPEGLAALVTGVAYV